MNIKFDSSTMIIQTKDPLFAHKCKKHNITCMVSSDDSGYDVYIIQGTHEDIYDLLEEVKNEKSDK